MKIIPFLRQNSDRSVFILLAISFVHHAGNACAEANLPNIFSWLLWLSISFYLILTAYEFVRQSLVKYQRIALVAIASAYQNNN